MLYRFGVVFMVWAMANWRYFNTLLQFAFRTNSFIRFAIDLLVYLWYTYKERLGKIMAFIVGCVVGLVVGVLFNIVANALKESRF